MIASPYPESYLHNLARSDPSLYSNAVKMSVSRTETNNAATRCALISFGSVFDTSTLLDFPAAQRQRTLPLSLFSVEHNRTWSSLKMILKVASMPSYSANGEVRFTTQSPPRDSFSEWYLTISGTRCWHCGLIDGPSAHKGPILDYKQLVTRYKHMTSQDASFASEEGFTLGDYISKVCAHGIAAIPASIRSEFSEILPVNAISTLSVYSSCLWCSPILWPWVQTPAQCTRLQLSHHARGLQVVWARASQGCFCSCHILCEYLEEDFTSKWYSAGSHWSVVA